MASSSRPAIQPRVYTRPQFCARYQIGPTTFYKEKAAKRLNVLKLGGKAVVTLEEGERWFRERTGQTGESVNA